METAKSISVGKQTPQSFSILTNNASPGGQGKREWFNIIQPSELPFNPAGLTIFDDGAFWKNGK